MNNIVIQIVIELYLWEDNPYRPPSELIKQAHTVINIISPLFDMKCLIYDQMEGPEATSNI